MPRGVRVRCPKCGYEWTYRGRRSRATCPGCGYTFRIGSGPGGRGGEIVWIVAVPESEWEGFLRAVEACARAVGGRLAVGEHGLVLDYLDEKDGELRLCLGGYGYGF